MIINPETGRLINTPEERKAKKAAKARRYRERHREELIEKKRAYYRTHRDERYQKSREWQANHPESVRASKLKWIKNNPEAMRAARRDWIARHPELFKLRGILVEGLKYPHGRNPVFTELVGCDTVEFRRHIARQFTEGMSWDNRGLKAWHIDHIKPCSAFDLSDPLQAKECFHFTNMRPLWAGDNQRKYTKARRE